MRRETQCWKCSKKITSFKNKKCKECGWLICSCGQCSSRKCKRLTKIDESNKAKRKRFQKIFYD